MSQELRFGLVISADGTAAIRTLDNLDDGLKRVESAAADADRSTSSTFDRLKQRAKGLGGTLVSVAKKATMFGGAFAGMASLIASNQLFLAAEVKQFSALANVNVEKFQELAAGANQYGIEQDKLADILKDTNDKVGDFIQTGGGAMADFFENIAPKVGVTKEMFKGLSGSDALQLYYDSLEKANVSQADMVFYLEAIASDATLLQPLLKNNGAEFDRLGQSARDAGMVMSEMDIENAAKIKGSIGQMSRMFDGFKVAAFKAMMPTLLSIAEAFENNQDKIMSWIGSFADGLSSMVGSVSSSWQTLKGGLQSVKDVAGSIGEALNTPENAERLQSAIQALGDGFSKLKDYASQTGNVITQVTDFFEANQEIIIPLASGIATAAGAFLLFNGAVAAWSAIGTAATAVTTGFGAAVALVTSPVTLTLAAITGLVAVGVLLYRNWDTIKAKATEVFNSLPGPVQEAFGNIKEAFSSIKQFASTAFDFLAPYVKATFGVVSAVVKTQWSVIKGVFSTSFAVIKGVVSTGFNAIKAIFVASISIIATVFNTGFKLVKNTIKTAFNAIKALARGDIKGFVSIIGGGLKNAVGIVKTGVGNIIRAFGLLAKKLFSIGVDAVQGLINGIKNKIKGAINVAKNLASSVSDTVKNYFVIRSPSRLFKKYGGWLSEGLALGIKGKESEAVKAALQMAQNISNAMDGLKKDIALFGDNNPLTSFDYDRALGAYTGIKDSILDNYRELIKAKQDLIAQAAADDFIKKQKSQLDQYAFETSLLGKQADEINILRFEHKLLAEQKKLLKGLSEENQKALKKETAEILEQYKLESKVRAEKQAQLKADDFIKKQKSQLDNYAFETSLLGKQADEINILRFEHKLLAEEKELLKGLSADNQQALKKENAEILEQYKLESKLRAKKQTKLKTADFLKKQQSELDKYAFETSLIGKKADEVERLRFERDLLNKAEQAGITLSDQARQQLNAEREALIAARKERQALLGKDWMAGIKSGYQSLMDGAKSLNETMAQATTGAFNKMSDSLATFVTTGKGNFKDLTASILQDISKMLIKFAMLRLAKAAVGMFENGGAFGGSGLLALAKGGAFNTHSIQYYANGDIFNKPTAFRHAGGLGVMGEAGPEAVMPLTRGPNGKLGVQVFGNQQTSAAAGVLNQVQIDISINHDGARSDVQTSTQDGKQLAESLKAVVLQTLQNEIRPGGMLSAR